MTYISQSSDFALHLQESSMYEHHPIVTWVSVTQLLTSK